MEIREIRKETVCKEKHSSGVPCGEKAKFAVFSKGRPRNFVTFTCEKGVDYYFDLQRKMHNGR